MGDSKMPKFEVTPELANMIKSARVQNDITAKAIAEHIGKSQSYLSRLESASIKTIEEETLTEIFRFIYQKNGDPLSLDAILEKIYSTIDAQFTDKEIEEQLWWDTYDTVLRRIPVPIGLVNYILDKISQYDIDISELCRRINANEAIYPKVKNEDSYPFNRWCAIVNNHKTKLIFIKLKIEEDYIRKVLNGKITSTCYMTMKAIVYYLEKMIKFGDSVDVGEEANDTLDTASRDCLNEYRFFSISEKYRLKKIATSIEEEQKLVSSFDRENQQLINKILEEYKLYTEMDIAVSNKMLEKYINNLEWDMGFMMALIGIEFCELKDTSFSMKKKLLGEIRKLVNEYKELPDEERKLNRYEEF